MQKILIKFWPIIFIFAIWFVFSSPYFLQGRVPYASTYQVNFFAPWSHYEEFWGPVKNNAMPDVHTQIYPWKKLTINTYKNGELPKWNPYNFSGNPHLANFQSAVLSPFNLLFGVLPFIDAWSMLILLQPLLTGVFMYLFVREIGASRVGSVISSIAFMFCGFLVVWMAYGTLGWAILYLPLALFAIEKYYKKKQRRFLLLLALTMPLSFFSGHFQISLYFFIAVISYILFKGPAGGLLLAVGLGLIFSLPQLLPSIRFYTNAVRSEIFQITEAIPFQYLITIIAPDFFGNPVTRNDWFGHYAEWAGFVGILPLLLSIYAILNLKSKIVIFFTILGLISLILAVNSPLSSFIVSLKIPVISTSALSRIIVLFSFAFAVLAGIGFDQLIKDVREVRVNSKIIGVLAAGGMFFIFIWLLLFISKVYPDEWLIVAKRNFLLPTLLFIGGILAVLISIKNKKVLLVASCYLLVISSFDSFRFAQKWMPFDPRGFVYPDVAVVRAMQRETKGIDRVFGNIGTEVTTYYNIPSIEGYDPLYIGRYGEFIRSAGEGKFLEGERSVTRLARRGKYTDRVLDLLGVKLIFHPIADTNAGWAYPVWEEKERYALVFEDEKFQLFKNKLALPRASLFYDYEVINNEKDILKRFYSPDFEFRKKLIIEEKGENLNKIRKGSGSANISSYTPNKIMIEVDTTTSAFLFLSDNYYLGWKVKVNGEYGKLYRADYSFRAVVVPEGKSKVEFIYENWHF